MQAWVVPPWALATTLDSAYPVHPIGVQHLHEEEGLGSEPWPGLQEGFLVKGAITQKTGTMYLRTSHRCGTRYSPYASCEGANVDEEDVQETGGEDHIVGRERDCSLGQPAVAVDGTNDRRGNNPQPGAGRTRPTKLTLPDGVKRAIERVY